MVDRVCRETVGQIEWAYGEGKHEVEEHADTTEYLSSINSTDNIYSSFLSSFVHCGDLS